MCGVPAMLACARAGTFALRRVTSCLWSQAWRGANDRQVAAVAHEQVERPSCWCCGNTFDDQHLTRLGSHPEVGVCAECARWLYRRARSSDTGARTPGGLLRRGVAAARGRVMHAGMQYWPVIGPLLRRLDGHLP